MVANGSNERTGLMSQSNTNSYQFGGAEEDEESNDRRDAANNSNNKHNDDAPTTCTASLLRHVSVFWTLVGMTFGMLIMAVIMRTGNGTHQQQAMCSSSTVGGWHERGDAGVGSGSYRIEPNIDDDTKSFSIGPEEKQSASNSGTSTVKDDSEEEMKKFTQFQTIGFQIYTGGASAELNADRDGNTTVPNPECVGKTSQGVLGGWERMCYLGLDDPADDVQARLKVMRDAVDKAHEVASTEDASVLKIFVAPEFFWRGVDGAYDFDQESFDRSHRNHSNNASSNSTHRCGAICQMLQGLEEIVDDDRFGSDWLFVFGTAIASQSLPTEDAFDYVFYNFAPVYRGGKEPLRGNVPSKHELKAAAASLSSSSAATTEDANNHSPNPNVGRRFLLPKRYVSKIDFLTPQRESSPHLVKQLVDTPLADQGSMVWNPIDFHQYRYGQRAWKKYKRQLQFELGYTFIEYGWLMVEDVALTLEICYDHKQRTALTSYLANSVQGSNLLIPRSRAGHGLDSVQIPTEQAHVSLVSSAGMQIQPASLALTDRGTLFLQDGLTDDSEVMFLGSSNFGCHLGDNCLEFDGGSEAVQRTAVLTETDVVFRHELVTTFQKHYVYDDANSTGGHWTSHLDRIFSVHAYEPMVTVFEPADIQYK